MIVTIDGPAGSGKSTVARSLARRLGVAYLDTGAMYRAVTLCALDANQPLDDAIGLARLASEVDLRLECDADAPRVWLADRDVSAAIRSLRVSQATGITARVPGVRAALVERQRQIGRELGSFVAEGRDQGSVVFPDADCKFLLDASLNQRADRRFREMSAGGDGVEYEQIVDNLRRRDAGDEIEWAPLREAADVFVLDTTRLSVDEVVDRMYERVTERQSAAVRSQEV